MDALKRAISLAGGQSALARAIGHSPQTISNWVSRGNVPAEHCPAIEAATLGAVRCEDLRPDVAWSVLRAPTEQAAA
jgi:DNA-binding transcriptional regulator YdaS (Cro superfamily)